MGPCGQQQGKEQCNNVLQPSWEDIGLQATKNVLPLVSLSIGKVQHVPSLKDRVKRPVFAIGCLPSLHSKFTLFLASRWSSVYLLFPLSLPYNIPSASSTSFYVIIFMYEYYWFVQLKGKSLY